MAKTHFKKPLMRPQSILNFCKFVRLKTRLKNGTGSDIGQTRRRIRLAVLSLSACTLLAGCEAPISAQNSSASAILIAKTAASPVVSMQAQSLMSPVLAVMLAYVLAAQTRLGKAENANE